MAGTTRPTANRVLRGAEQDGLIALGRGRITVLDRTGIEKRAR
jgi:CRP/FNR family cyclic AMP-dependent transcriptional regulator